MFKELKLCKNKENIFWDFIKHLEGIIDKNWHGRLLLGLDFTKPHSHAYNHSNSLQFHVKVKLQVSTKP